MTRYEAIGCGVYEVDPTAKPGDPDEREPVACTGDEDGPAQHPYDGPFNGDREQLAMARRIADALNGSEALVEALRAMYDECHSESPEATKAFSKARAALAAHQGETK